MNEYTPPVIHHAPSADADEQHQTVIKFVLSGPILGGQPEVAHVPAPSAELTELRERLSLLERALSEADSRFEAMQQALAATVAAAAANAVGAAAAPPQRMAPQPAAPAYAVETVPEPPAPEPEPVQPDYELPPAATFEEYAPPAPVNDFAAPPAAEPAPYYAAPATVAEPVYAPVEQPPVANGYASLLADPYAPASYAPVHETSPLAMAVMPDPEPLSLVTQPAVPALRTPEPGPPKVRGLRRMMAVLKNL
jgi:hypothetical protein